MTLSAVMRRMEVDAVPHGFRSTFRDWGAERTNFPSEMLEMAACATVGDKVEAAYSTGRHVSKSAAPFMDAWAAFLAAPAGGNVTDLSAAGCGMIRRVADVPIEAVRKLVDDVDRRTRENCHHRAARALQRR